MIFPQLIIVVNLFYKAALTILVITNNIQHCPVSLLTMEAEIIGINSV